MSLGRFDLQESVGEYWRKFHSRQSKRGSAKGVIWAAMCLVEGRPSNSNPRNPEAVTAPTCHKGLFARHVKQLGSAWQP